MAAQRMSCREPSIAMRVPRATRTNKAPAGPALGTSGGGKRDGRLRRDGVRVSERPRRSRRVNQETKFFATNGGFAFCAIRKLISIVKFRLASKL